MTTTLWAHQYEAIGFNVCADVRVVAGEANADLGQQGWEVGINYSTTEDLLAKIEHQIHEERILALGLALHGSMAANDPRTFGGYAINGTGANQAWLLESTLESFAPFIRAIGRRLEINGIVYFFGCSAAATDPGRRLLMRLSAMWPRRRVVGFTQEGMQLPGGQYVRNGSYCDYPGVRFGDSWGDWGMPSAVVALNGNIVRG